MADGVHTGSAYIRVLPDFRSWNSQVRRQLAGSNADFAKAGAEAGRSFSRGFAAAARSESVRVTLDTKEAEGQLAVLRRQIQGASSDMHLLSTTAAALGPALIPVLGVATAGMIGFGAAVASAGSAFGLFGAVAASHLSQLNKDLTKVQAANKAANVARATPAGKRTSTQKQAIATAKAMTAEFKKDYGVLAGAQEKLSNAWKAFTSQPFINSTLAKGMALLVQVLPKLNPLLRLGADAVQVLTGALAGWVQSGGLDRVVKGLTSLGRNVAIPGFIKILHNLATTFGALAPSAGKFAAGTVGALVKLTGALAGWAKSKGSGVMDRFLAVVRQDGPKVLSLLGGLSGAAFNIVRSLNPLAPVSLAVATALSKIIAATPPWVITAIAGAFLAWKLATTGFSAIVKGIQIATKLWAAAQWLLNAAMDANPIGLVIVAIGALVAGVIYAYNHFAWFRNLVQAIWGWIKQHWPLLVEILTGPLGIAIVWIIKHWSTVEHAFSASVHFLRGAFADLWDFLAGIFGKILDGAAHAFGWIPGIGPKLKAADQAFKKWAKSVDSSIRGIHGKTASITFQLGDFVKNGGGVGHPVPHGAARGMLVTGGTAGRDSVLIRAMPGEVIVPTAMVRAGAVDHLRGRIPGFAAGGQVGLGLSQHLAPVPPFISHLTSAIGRQVAQLGQSLIPSGPAGGIGGGVARWAALIVQVLRMLHQPLGYLGAVEHRMMQESGGNPRAINLWDSNAAAGDPSRGLMQTIGSTFRAYAGPFAGLGIYNPLANIYAGLNYALHRYPGRSLASVMLQPGGYDSGGMLPPGYSTVYNGTGRPEPVLTGAQWDMIAASARGGDGDVYNFGDVGGTIEGRIRASLAAADLVKRNTQRTGRRR